MKKKLAMILATILVIGALSACGLGNAAESAAPAAESAKEEAEAPAEDSKEEAESTAEPAAEPAADATMVTFSTPMTGIQAEKLQELCDDITAATGTLDVQLFTNNALGAQRDMFNALAAGEIELILDGSIPVDMFAPEYGFLVAPFLIRDLDHLQAIIDSPIYQEYIAKLEESNITILGTYKRGSRETCSNGVNDWSNPSSIIIRMPDVAAYVAAWQAVGCNTQVMGGGEVYSSMQNGVINTTEGPYEQMVSANYNEVADTLYETNHVQEFYCIYASKSWYDGLDDATKAIVDEKIAAWIEQMDGIMAQAATDSKQALLDAGMTEVEIDVDALFNAVTPVWEKNFEDGTWASSYDEVMKYYAG